MKTSKAFVCIFAALNLVSISMPFAAEQKPVFRPDRVVFCSDGEFDWESGQSLYDFVILERDDNKFIISYLGIPHPSFETRDFFHAWLKIRGQFSASLTQQGKTKTYRMKMNMEGAPKRVGTLTIGSNDKYRFTVTPPLDREVTKAGLCWDSLD